MKMDCPERKYAKYQVICRKWSNYDVKKKKKKKKKKKSRYFRFSIAVTQFSAEKYGLTDMEKRKHLDTWQGKMMWRFQEETTITEQCLPKDWIRA